MKANTAPAGWLLGIECGGTHTVALLTDAAGVARRRLEAGPANLRLLSDAQLVRQWRALRRALPAPAALGIGMAGARDERDAARIRRLAAQVWPGVPCWASHDLDTALAAAETASAAGPAARVMVLSGTGSCCYGRHRGGKIVKVGGWGHILGDKGSGYEIGLRALKAVVFYLDRDGEWSTLGERILRALQLNEPDDLIAWVQTATKTEIAALTVEVFAAAARRDRIARDILAGAAQLLAKDAVSCARRLVKPNTPVEFVLAGSVLLKQPRFAAQVGRHVRALWPGATVTPLRREGAWGAIAYARRELEAHPASATPPVAKTVAAPTAPAQGLPRPTQLSPTEQRHPRSRKLDRLPVRAAIELMLRDDEKIPAAIRREAKAIEQAIGWIVKSLRGGGRLFYVGAGTSGRLGVLDASECPPTFRTAPEQVQGIIAGGQRALWQSIEGAEDDAPAGAAALRFRGVGQGDVVLGIAASGRTPFVWGALAEARRRGSKTILLCFNPHLEIPRALRPHLVIAPDIGPEILTGSTRLKAGTATKLILNLLTTLTMVRLGKVVSNLMVDLNPSNTKLRERAVRIVRELTGRPPAQAEAALKQERWVVKAALQRLGRTC